MFELASLSDGKVVTETGGISNQYSKAVLKAAFAVYSTAGVPLSLHRLIYEPSPRGIGFLHSQNLQKKSQNLQNLQTGAVPLLHKYSAVSNFID